MVMFQQKDFEDIRPYHDEEINPALNRIVAIPEFYKILEFFFPERDKNQIIANLSGITTSLDFQKQFMHPLVYSIVHKTSEGLTTGGFDKLVPGKPYLFVANHRDIVLDSAILQVVLLDFGHATSEITFGSNLMTNQFIIDLGKVNRMFKVFRGGNRRELFRNSQLLSAYIRYTITKKHVSAWIAQRSGRTKDGSDKTEPGLLKMFNISGSKDIRESFDELNILPLVISYEYEPCCSLKVKETMHSLKGISYQKEPNEDLMSIITGITQPKGHIHIEACTPLNEFLYLTEALQSTNDKINKLTEIIDSQIYSHYKLWPNNYIAYDMLDQGREYADYYTPADEEQFMDYMQRELSLFKDVDALYKEVLLKIYANAVLNARLKL
jgi:hypothetical protein